jgi:phosphoglycolate phosphatase
MIDAVLFDKDGTLFDFRISWGGWAAGFLSDLAASPDEALRLGEAIGYDPRTQSFAPDSPVIAATAADIAAALLPRLPHFDLAGLTQRIDVSAAAAPMAEAVPLRPLLQALRDRGLRLGVATNDSEAPARQHLASHGVTGFFDLILGADSGHGPKPGPGMCLAFADRMALPPGRVVMVGDSRHDLQAGRAAGMRTVAVLTGVAAAGQLADLADAVLPDIGALPAWLDRLSA